MNRLTAILVTMLLPTLLVLGNVFLVMTPAWLAAVYNRPGFPSDPYGLTTSQRIELATGVINWLTDATGAKGLQDLRLAEGDGLFGSRELRHLRDVKHLTGAAFRVFGVALVAMALLALHALRKGAGARLALALTRGAVLTLAALAGLALLVLTSWDVAFIGFHRLFFESGTWYFAWSDTLIRVFPEQFWIDALLFVAGLTALESLALVVLLKRNLVVWNSGRGLLYWLAGKSGVMRP